MAYPSLTLHLLVSAPADVSSDDQRVVREAIDTWNFSSGRWVAPTPVTVVPVLWGIHAYSRMGVRPQEAINKQFVEEADLALAMFADRLGTPTGEADSGTLEEIDVMRRAGKHVSLLHNTSPRSLNGVQATEEKMRLEQYLHQVRSERQGLVFEYDNQLALSRQVTLMLSGQAMSFSQMASRRMTDVDPGSIDIDQDSRIGSVDSTIGIWPTTEVVERPGTDSKGRPKTSRNWFLVLTNATGKPANNVRFRYESDDGGQSSFDIGSGDERRTIAVMPPAARQRFPILAALGSAPDAMCVVSWEDGSGSHETRATVMR